MKLLDLCRISTRTQVTSCVEVWVETGNKVYACPKYSSPPAWRCGLKQAVTSVTVSPATVTSCVEVWVETCGYGPVL